MKKMTEQFQDDFLVVGAAIVVMVLLPGVIVGVAGSDAGLLISIFLLFVVNPMFFILSGAYLGKKAETPEEVVSAIRPLVLSGGAFLFGSALLLKMGFDFAVRYMAAYLLIGLVAAGVAALSKRKKKKQ